MGDGAEVSLPTLVRTSETHPIDVYWVPDEAHAQAGRLGLTFAPGKCGRGLVTAADWERDLHVDLDRLRDHHGADVLVSLMEQHEYDLLQIPTLFAEATARGIDVDHLPIEDVRVPRADQSDAVTALVVRVRGRLAAGHRVVVHCRGGIGRSGLIASIVVGSYGHSAARAIAIVRTAQPSAVETHAQERYVAEALAAWSAGA